MAGFHTHITTSTVVGIGYGAVGYAAYDFSFPTCVVAGGMCSVAGMFPDLDSDSGIPLRELLSFGAAIMPVLMLERWIALGFTPEMISLGCVLMYILVRFGIGGLIKRLTVHRGMFHSIPAALIFGLVAYLVCASHDEPVRYFKALGVFIGFMSHLILDEIWSVEWTGLTPRFKKSFGTAMKISGDNFWANLATYGQLVLLTYVAINDPYWMETWKERREARLQQIADRRERVLQQEDLNAGVLFDEDEAVREEITRMARRYRERQNTK